jgi:hypothetical protein
MQRQTGGKAALPPKRSYRETPDVASAVARMIRSIGVRCAGDDPDTLILLRELEQALEHAWATAIEGMRASGHSDRVIAGELGVTRQAVEQRWPRARGGAG